MSDDLFLIAHKVRGAPTFDIAIHLTCPVCDATNDHCPSCDGVGHWWIIPTSGHRAYPYWDIRLEDCTGPMHENSVRRIHISLCGELPKGLRDHYTTEAETARSLIDTLGLKAQLMPTQPILRRL